MKYRCPKCKGNDGLSVVVKQWAALCYNEKGDFEGTDTDAKTVPDHDQEWDQESAMRCNCGFTGKARDFNEVAQEETEEEKEYTVSVCRIGYGHTEIDVKARSIAAAENLAIDKAGDISYSEHTSDYVVDTCTLK